MKELDPINTSKEEIHIVQDKKDQQEYTFLGSMIIFKGCKLWSFNRETMEFKQVKLKTEIDAVMPANKDRISFMDLILKRPAQSIFHHRADFDPRCMYVIAINARNAAKKFNRMLPPQTQILVKKDYGQTKR